MKKSLLFLLSFLGLFISGFSQSNKVSYQKNDNTLLWEVSANGLATPSYLFGTFHLMCKDDIIFSKNFSNALSNANTLVMEIDLSDAKNTFGAIEFLKMKNDTTLKMILSQNEYNRLSMFFKDSLKMSLTFFENMKPVFLQALFYPKMMSCKQSGSLEEAIMAQAKKANKQIKGLETIELQSALLDNLSYQEQAKSLMELIDDFNNQKLNFEQLLMSYKSQNAKEMSKLIESDPELKNQKPELLDNRNLNWVNQFEQLMPNASLFVAVGAGHLFGELGLIQLLRKKGYQLKPIENKN
ncbi:MAG: TraB/GumN family protein [Sphingobacteriales bacterium]|nr:TraB/GumN family protein [Sphingobacteriales bacterium]